MVLGVLEQWVVTYQPISKITLLSNPAVFNNQSLNKMTAVEWLHEIAKQREPDKFDWKQAKEMEREQLEKKYQEGKSDQVKDQEKPQTIY